MKDNQVPHTLEAKNEEFSFGILGKWLSNAQKSYEEIDRKLIDHNDHKERDRFGSYLEYLVSVLGFAAGFGSVWRFPYLVFKNGGGVFMIPYFTLLFLIGVPAFYFETSLG